MQVCVDILNGRVMKATLAFKQFLTDHQQVIKVQEAKKERLKNASPFPDGVNRSNTNKGKMKILPPHRYSQLSTNESSTDSNEGNGGMFAMEL